jgi:flagellar hook-basal body complex protein FliE
MDVGPIGSFQNTLAHEMRRTSDGKAFNQVIEQFIGDVNQKQLNADAAVQALITGETDNVQEVMLKMSQADLSFRMFMEVRSRVTDAYQEVMRTQI